MRPSLKFLIFLSLALILHFSGHASSVDPEGPQQTINMVEMEIEEESISIDISFNGSFSGQVHCRAVLLLDLGILVEYVDLYIEPEYPDYLSVVLEDYEVRLTSEEPIFEFTANISVDTGSSASLRPIVVMGGTAKTNRETTGGVITDSASIRILPYYSATIFFETPTGQIDIGSTRTFELTISNTGNAGEYFILDIADIEILASKDIEVTFEDSDVFVEEGGTKVVDVKVKVGSGSTRGSYLVKILVWSKTNGKVTEEDTTATLTLNVDKAYIQFVEGLIKEPVYLYIGIGAVLVLIGLGIWGLIKLREHVLWKRTLRRVREANLQEHTLEDGVVVEGVETIDG